MQILLLLAYVASAIATELLPTTTETFNLLLTAPCENESWQNSPKYSFFTWGEDASNLGAFSLGQQQHSTFYKKLFSEPVVKIQTSNKVKDTGSLFSTTVSPAKLGISYPDSIVSSGTLSAQRESSNKTTDIHYASHGIPTIADSIAESTTSSPSSYVNSESNLIPQTTSWPFYSTSKSVQIISNTDDVKPLYLKNYDNVSPFTHNSTTKTYSPLAPKQSSIFSKSEGISNVASRQDETKPITYHKLSVNRDPTSIPNYVTTSTSRYPSKFSYNTDLSFGKHSTSTTPLWNRASLSTPTPKTHSIKYDNLPKVTNVPVYKPYSTLGTQKSLPYVLDSKSDSVLHSSKTFSESHYAEPSIGFTATSPTFPIFTSSTPSIASALSTANSYPYSGSVTTPNPPIDNPSKNYSSVKFSSFTSTTSKPYSKVTLPKSDVLIQPGSTKYSSFQNVVSKPAPVVWNGLSNRFLSDSVSKTPSHIDLSLHSDPVFAPAPVVSLPAYSTASLVRNSANSETHSLPTWHNIQSLQNTPVLGKLARYSDSVFNKAIYSTPVPISFPSFQSTSAPAHVSYPPVFSTTWNQYSRKGSEYTASQSPYSSGTYDSKVAYNVEKAPLKKEYHTVETPLVSTWETVDTWKVSLPQHAETFWY